MTFRLRGHDVQALKMKEDGRVHPGGCSSEMRSLSHTERGHCQGVGPGEKLSVKALTVSPSWAV